MTRKDYHDEMLEIADPVFCPRYASASARSLYEEIFGAAATCARELCRNGCLLQTCERDVLAILEPRLTPLGMKLVLQRIIDAIPRKPKGSHDPGRDVLLMTMYWYLNSRYGERVGRMAQHFGSDPKWMSLLGLSDVKDPVRTIERRIRQLLKANGVKTGPRGRPKTKAATVMTRG